MSMYTVTVIKSGNSYALRVTKKYIDDSDLELGQKVDIQIPVKHVEQDRSEIQRLIKQLQKINTFKEIEDPISWQRSVRQERELPDRD